MYFRDSGSVTVGEDSEFYRIIKICPHSKHLTISKKTKGANKTKVSSQQVTLSLKRIDHFKINTMLTLKVQCSIRQM